MLLSLALSTYSGEQKYSTKLAADQFAQLMTAQQVLVLCDQYNTT